MRRPTVYTSFDGDHMVFIDCMREFAVKNGFVPINPEHALGYYLSTRAHADSKSEVMKDCLSLVTIADEFWVFTHGVQNPLAALSEGVLIEMLHWIRKKKSAVNFFDISNMMRNLSRNDSGTLRQDSIRSIQEKDFSDALSERSLCEIADFQRMVSDTLRPVVYIDIRNEDFKYVDWVRQRAYQTGFVPIVPQHLMPEHVYLAHNIHTEYNEDLEGLKCAYSCIWAIYESQERLEKLSHIYGESQQKVTFISIRDLGVPKYANPRKWSITTKELKEVLNRE